MDFFANIGTNLDFFTAVAVAFGVSLSLLSIAWIMQLGLVRGALASLCRVGWTIPIFLSFFPETVTEQLPRTMTLQPVHVLIDDSESMRGQAFDPAVRRDGSVAGSPFRTADALRKTINDGCLRFGCLPKFTLLSEQDEDVRQGYTPLSSVIDSWLYKVGGDPWLLVSDGGDFRPTERWDPALRGLGRPGGDLPVTTPRALIVGFPPKSRNNIWIKDSNVAPFSFEDKPLTVDVNLRRVTADAGSERVQLQVMAEDKPLATVNAEFKGEELEARVSATIPPLPRGQHLLTIRALPVANETALWDNTAYAQIEVMPNTVGVLHLLGSPSWDGRFMRRYLKSEPKYDLISFFILRDPWDSQQVSERELSLIPFPVERLFKEELPNFRVVVIQNFTLYQFLLPEYQANLVKFVQDGGGLLFIGGPRALAGADLSSSPLRAILPFEVTDDQALSSPGLGAFDLGALEGEGMEPPSPAEKDTRGPAYDENLEFKVELAKPDANKRALANVYEDWESLADSLTGWKTAKGLHHMERVKFKKDVVTPLLTARTSVGKTEIPLAVASYPGKGRAIWLFSDSLWRLAQTVDSETSRQVYNRFLQASMTWLMRQDLRKPLVAKNFALKGGRHQAASFRVTLQGPAARFFQPSPEWKLKVCGAIIPPDKLVAVKTGADEFDVSGPLSATLAGGERCSLELDGSHPAFGSVRAGITAVFPEVFKDTEIDAAPQKLEELAQLTGARLALPPKDADAATQEWLEEITGKSGVALPSRFKTLRNFYWVLDRSWFWALVLLMPLEVIIRRWHQLFGSARKRNADLGVSSEG